MMTYEDSLRRIERHLKQELAPHGLILTDEMPQTLDHLLSVTRRRLIISVPYEKQATLAYGHQQVFTREKLEQWGKWCVEHLRERGRFWCEDIMGGLLVVERQ